MDFRVHPLIFLKALILWLLQARAGATNGSSKLLKARKQSSECNLFIGSWALDPSYPLYDPSDCPFIDNEFNCQKFGRPDTQYLKYSWKPDSCSIPRYYYYTSVVFFFFPFVFLQPLMGKIQSSFLYHWLLSFKVCLRLHVWEQLSFFFSL